MELTVNIMKFDTPNKSGRIYTKSVIEEAIKQFNENKNKFGTVGEILESGDKLAIAPRMQVDIQEEKDEEGNTILNEDGKPKTYIKSANIISVDVIPNEYRTFEYNTIKIGET